MAAAEGGAEMGAAAGLCLGALEGAEAGAMGGPFGMLAGAAIGAAGSAGLASVAFRNRESTEQQDHFLDVRSVNGGNASVRPLRTNFVTELDQRGRNPEVLRPRRHDDAPAYYRIDEDDAPTDHEAGRQQEPLRPTAARTPMQPRLTAQGVIDSIAASLPLPPEVLRLQRKAARNRLAPGQSAGPPGSIQDVMQATAAPTGGAQLHPPSPLELMPVHLRYQYHNAIGGTKPVRSPLLGDSCSTILGILILLMSMG